MVNYVQSVVKKGRGILSESTLQCIFLFFSFNRRRPTRKIKVNPYTSRALDGAHAPCCLGPHTSSVLFAELNAAESAHANRGDEESTPDAGDGESN